jgi:hypothetical protein
MLRLFFSGLDGFRDNGVKYFGNSIAKRLLAAAQKLNNTIVVRAYRSQLLAQHEWHCIAYASFHVKAALKNGLVNAAVEPPPERPAKPIVFVFAGVVFVHVLHLPFFFAP